MQSSVTFGDTTIFYGTTTIDPNPLTEDEKQILTRFFKPEYLPKVIEFAENSPTFRRRRLFKMLDFASGNRPVYEPLTSPRNDLAFNQNGGFGLTWSFSGHRSSRKTSPNRFASPGITENGIFGYPSTRKQFGKTMPTKTISHAHFIVDRYVRPEKSDDVLRVSDEFSGLLQELEKHVDRKAGISSSSTQPVISFSSRNIQTAGSPRRQRTIRLDDPTMKELYKSDSRWSPRSTRTRPF